MSKMSPQVSDYLPRRLPPSLLLSLSVLHTHADLSYLNLLPSESAISKPIDHFTFNLNDIRHLEGWPDGVRTESGCLCQESQERKATHKRALEQIGYRAVWAESWATQSFGFQNTTMENLALLRTHGGVLRAASRWNDFPHY